MAGNGLDPQRSILKDAVGVQAAELAPVGPQILFPAARIDIIRATDPVTGVPIVNLVITAGNGAFSVVVPIPALVTKELAMVGVMSPPTVQIAEKLVAPNYRVVRVDSSTRDDAPAAAGGRIDVEAEVDA
jgi:hypothetical protein